jgi:hypothetical protein
LLVSDAGSNIGSEGIEEVERIKRVLELPFSRAGVLSEE